MKARKRFIAISLFFVCLASRAAFAVPTTPAQAENVVRGWLIYDSSPFGKLAGEFSKVESYGEGGKTSNPSEALYYAVHLDPSGIVLLPADDELNPITAYASDADWYGPEPANPLYDTIGASIAEMVKIHRGGKRRGSGVSEAREMWATFQDLALSGAKRGKPLPDTPSTVIVEPLLTTEWDQEGLIEGSEISYNEYTPEKYPAGCGAVMMAQIMKFFGYPTASISALTGIKEYPYKVDGQTFHKMLIGGSDDRGPYNISEPTPDQIARLIADCAVAIESAFAKDETGSNPALIAESLRDTFGYGNAVLAMPDLDYNWKDSALEKALNANLDARKPVGLGIFKSGAGDIGHGVVADGYGYSGGKTCYHINMGWGGQDNVWYDLPGILKYDLIKSVIYNIYDRNPTSGTEIISGKLATSSDVTVTMASTSVGSKGAYVFIDGDGFSDHMSIIGDDGRFVFVGVPSNTEFTITAQLAGHSFPPKTVRTGSSGATVTSVGNVWGVIIKEPLYSGESPFGGGGCDAAALPALFAAVGAGVVLFVRKRR